MGRCLLLLAFLPLCGACERAPAGPDEVYRAFHMAIAAGDWDRAVAFLTPETLDAFRSVGQQLTEAVGHDEDPLVFFLRGVRAEVVRPLREVKVLAQDEQKAQVQVVAGQCADAEAEGDAQPAALECSVSRVHLERRDDRWLIRADLPRAFGGPAQAARGG